MEEPLEKVYRRGLLQRRLFHVKVGLVLLALQYQSEYVLVRP